MKFLIPLTLLGAMLAGCSSFQRAMETAERTREAMELAGNELRDAMEVADTARETYTSALKDGDNDKVLATLEALRAAESERRERELDFQQTQRAFEQASRELERAKAEDNYLEGILGLIFGGLIGGGGGFLTGRRRRE